MRTLEEKFLQLKLAIIKIKVNSLNFTKKTYTQRVKVFLLFELPKKGAQLNQQER